MNQRQTWQKKLRVKMGGQLGVVWPETAQLLINHFKEKCSTRGLVTLSFTVGGLPISLNHMYEKGLGSSYCKPNEPGAFQDSKGRWRKTNQGGNRPQMRLRQEAIDWRVAVAEAMGEDRWKWKPTGVTAAIILFETPRWITYSYQVREMDADNKTKPALDAVQHATEIPDELHWEIHVYKVLSKRQRTHVYLFDLGDVVEFFS